MPFIKFVLICVLFCAGLLACKENKLKCVLIKKEPLSIAKAPGKKLRIIDHGTIEFGKSFSFIHSSDMSDAEKDRESLRLQESDPLLTSNEFIKNPAIDSLLPLLTKAGIVKDRGFRYNQFKEKKDSIFRFWAANGERLDVSFSNLEGKQPIARYNRIIISSGAERDTAETTVYFEPCCFFTDVIPGGNKEIVLLNEDYAANHYFYYLTVYEIKTK